MCLRVWALALYIYSSIHVCCDSEDFAFLISNNVKNRTGPSSNQQQEVDVVSTEDKHISRTQKAAQQTQGKSQIVPSMLLFSHAINHTGI